MLKIGQYYYHHTAIGGRKYKLLDIKPDRLICQHDGRDWYFFKTSLRPMETFKDYTKCLS